MRSPWKREMGDIRIHFTEGQLDALVQQTVDVHDKAIYTIRHDVFACPSCGAQLVASYCLESVDETGACPLTARLRQHYATHCRAQIAKARRRIDDIDLRSPMTMARLFPRWGKRVAYQEAKAQRAFRRTHDGDFHTIIAFMAEQMRRTNGRFLAFCRQTEWHASGIWEVARSAESRTFVRTPVSKNTTRKPRNWHAPAFHVATTLRTLGAVDMVPMGERARVR